MDKIEKLKDEKNTVFCVIIMRLENFKRDNRPIIISKLDLFKEGFSL